MISFLLTMRILSIFIPNLSKKTSNQNHNGVGFCYSLSWLNFHER